MFRFTVTLKGKATATGQKDAWEIDSSDGFYGDMEFHSNNNDKTEATFWLKAGESKTAVNLSEGLTYEVKENLTEAQKKKYGVIPADFYTSTIGENKGRTDVDPYTSDVPVTNILPVCKITDNGNGLLYRQYSWNDKIVYIPAVYTELTGDKGAFEALKGNLYHVENGIHYLYPVSNGVKIQMLINQYPQKEAITLPADISGNAVLTTASSTAKEFPYQSEGTTSTITRSFTESEAISSMFTVGGTMTLEKIILDGAKNKYIASVNGGIVNVPAGGTLSINDGAVLKNSKTNLKGGAVYADSNAHIIMSGGTIRENESIQEGAGIYLNENSRLELSNTVNFGGKGTDIAGNIVEKDGNYQDLTLSIETTNGGKRYDKPRQDIFIAGFEGDEENKNANSLVITGDIDSVAGGIWVWAEKTPHYETLKQFGKIEVPGGGTVNETTLSAFRNAQPDTVSKNEQKDQSIYLTGMKMNDSPQDLFWSGIVGKSPVLLRKILLDSDKRSALEGAIFTVYRNPSISAPIVKDVNGNDFDGAYGILQKTISKLIQ